MTHGGFRLLASGASHRWGIHWAAPVLALGVFSVDTFTDIRSAIAVLYVLVLLLAGPALSRRGIIVLASICCGLTFLSFLIAHGLDADTSTLLRCAVAIAAIVITAGLLLQNDSARQLLIQSHAALSRSESRYRSMFEQTRFSLWEQDFSKVMVRLDELRGAGVDDLRGHLEHHPDVARQLLRDIVTLDVNDATVELLDAPSRADIIGSLERYVNPDDPALLGVLDAIYRGANQFEGTGRLLRHDGTPLTVLLGMTFPDDPGGFDRIVAGIADITQREQTREALMAAQSELARASRAATLGALSASIAHELNQPLGALVMNAQTCLRWLRREPPDITAAINAGERIVRDAKRASEIVQHTRSQVVRGLPEDEPVDLATLIEDTVALLDREIAMVEARVVTNVAPGIPSIHVNRTNLQQVLLNLMNNGLQAMAETRGARLLTITVAREEADDIAVSIRDRGTGIAEESLARLFDPFFTTKSGGMGMGLAICRSTIEGLGGRLSARNDQDGGAVFEFTIPIS
ncbi:C4-dicarboxylate-specific signal transduction histidine kinase [Rhodoligotrophos appendicifer]|uniref:sensor histidine kinase n=1 Tax=Rhodoligotrophos appendicifer TaxID=987056 RepID=UPI00147898E2|nr:ATP-binding protein [Rhodoligotrophos appendicifer]